MGRVKVSQATKREFKENKEKFKSEGIRSSIALQRHKNAAAQIKRSTRKTQRDAIREAYNRERERFEAIGYTERDFIKVYNDMLKYNEKIQKAKQKGVLSPFTAQHSFPISVNTGKINMSRLSNVVKRMKRTVTQIKQSQEYAFYNNIRELYGDDIYNYARETLRGVPYGHIVNVFSQYNFIDFIVKYDLREFDDDSFSFHWEPLRDSIVMVVEAIKEAGGTLL